MARAAFDYKKCMVPVQETEKRLIAIGLQLERDIKKSMVAGTGRTYVKGKKKDIIHVASAPGQPPAVDTGRLRASISTNWSGSILWRGKTGPQAEQTDGIGRPTKKQEKFTVVVGSNVAYAPFLEFGTRKMAARPYMRPAFDRIKNRIARMIASEG